MRKEYTKLTRQILNENKEPVGEVEETVLTSLIADEGMTFKDMRTGFVGGTRIDIGTGDSEENYIEVEREIVPKEIREQIEKETVEKIVKEVSEYDNAETAR